MLEVAGVHKGSLIETRDGEGDKKCGGSMGEENGNTRGVGEEEVKWWFTMGERGERVRLDADGEDESENSLFLGFLGYCYIRGKLVGFYLGTVRSNKIEGRDLNELNGSNFSQLPNGSG
ncbi:hypothetical protein HAX54_030591, partial [Datura stramonium]|nr:hypothetical protein [Datura stramonium]